MNTTTVMHAKKYSYEKFCLIVLSYIFQWLWNTAYMISMIILLYEYAFSTLCKTQI
jgi:hypothetical protein